MRPLVTLLLLFVLALAPAQAQDAEPADTTTAPVEASGDEALESQMQAVFSSIDDFQDVQVAVQNGVVRLTGEVTRGEMVDRAEALAARFPDVLYVDNDIDQATDVEARVTPAIARIQEYWDDTVAALPVFAVALLVLLVFWGLARLIDRWRLPIGRLGVTPLGQSLVNRSVRAVLLLIGLVLALDVLGVTALVGALLGTAGVVGLAIGFAFQDIVENYLAGVLLSLRRPFGVGDMIRIQGQEGKVVRLTSRELVLMTLEGNHLRLPNATVFKNDILNYTRNPLRRFDFVVGVGVQEDLADVMPIGLSTLRAMAGVLDDPEPFARVEGFGDSSMTVCFHGWVDQREVDFAKVRSEAIRLVKVALDDADVDLPEPIYRVLTGRLPEPSLEPEEPASRETLDVSPDTVLDEQVQDDLAASDERNLLVDEDGRSGKGEE
ncbi:MAG: mechanosensitive ion channel [Bacteroidetes bacterium]|nr:mechanosensitive ion channel [Bacteroidota bacterium]